MNILWLHSHFLYSTGGTRFVYEIAKRLNKTNKVSVCVEKASVEWKNKYKTEAIPLHEISNITSTSLTYWMSFPVQLYSEKNKIQKWINEADVVIASMFPMQYLGAQFRKPLVYYCFEPYAFFYDKSLLNGLPIAKRVACQLLQILYEPIDKSSAKKATKILTINKSVERLIKRTYNREVDALTYMGVDTEHFKKKSTPKPSKWKNNILLFHSTDYTEMKGTMYVLKAMLYIAKAFPNVKLLISESVEDSDTKNKYIEEIKKNDLQKHVEFVGKLSYQELPNYFSFTDVICFAANPDSIGTTASLFVLEAMACESAVIRSIGCDEEVENNVSGILEDPRKVENYAAKVIILLKNKKMRERFGKNAREKILKEYQWDSSVKIFQKELLESVSGNYNKV